MTQLDKTDTKILSLLTDNPKATYSELARQIKTSKEVIRYRIEKLEKEEIILGYKTILGFKYWAYKILIQTTGRDEVEEKTLLQKIAKHKRTSWVTSCSGHWDIVFGIMAKDPKDFEEQWNNILKDIGQYIQKYSFAISLGSKHFGLSLLPEIQKDKTVKNRSSKPIDEKDSLILHSILDDARKKVIDIHKETKLPVDTIVYRIKKLEQSGIIRRYRLILNTKKLGFQDYEIFINTKFTKDISYDFFEFAKNDKRISFAGKLSGLWNLELTAHVTSSEELKHLLNTIKKEFSKHIKSIHTVTLFDTIKYTFEADEIE